MILLGDVEGELLCHGVLLGLWSNNNDELGFGLVVFVLIFETAPKK